MYIYVLAVFSFILYVMTKKKDSIESRESNAKWCNWSKYSPTLLKSAEKEILSNLHTSYEGKYVNIGPVVGKYDNLIWTICLNKESSKIPLVMLHGMGAGVALWVMNLDELAAERPVYAIDLLGFASSSRPTFSSDPKIVEMQMVCALEEWIRVMKLDKIVLLGHSLGGFISTSYAMQYPSRIHHLILADAWGLSECPEDIIAHYNLPGWVRVISVIARPFNPLWTVRAAGPWGPGVISRARKDIVAKFKKFLPNAEELIPKYIYQCNSQNPTGESAFHVMMHQFAFAKNPMVRRIHRLDENVPLTMLFGSHSWVDRSVGHVIINDRSNSYVNMEIIHKSGHHVNLDDPSEFNRHVLYACNREDAKLIQVCACSKSN